MEKAKISDLQVGDVVYNQPLGVLVKIEEIDKKNWWFKGVDEYECEVWVDRLKNFLFYKKICSEDELLENLVLKEEFLSRWKKCLLEKFI